jgi:HEPN domain-containing protein
MPPDRVRAADARAWLANAAQDLRRVDLLLAADPPNPEGGLFHSQQAAEMALKLIFDSLRPKIFVTH